MSVQGNFQHRKILSNWLFASAAFVVVMIVVGAITRLTESGLSMVEWRPLIGALPPLSEQEWERVFAAYQESPEFQKKNSWMEMADFKRIFFWEWFHRLWGRLIGLVYGVPFLVFMIRGMVPRGYRLKLFGMLILGGLQGYMGWYMVQSGLVDQPAVSHYRLAAHLSLAFLIVSLLLWLGLSIRGVERKPNAGLYAHGWIALGALIMTIFWGAYVAGLDAGLIYNTYPLMNGHFIAPEIWQYSPFWVNFYEQVGGVQFTHRWLAAVTVVIVLSYVVRAWIGGFRTPVVAGLGAMVLLQFALGIVTLLSMVALPVAVMHQLGAVVLLLLLVSNLYLTRPQSA